MSVFGKHAAHERAISIVTAALQSNSIRLNGAVTMDPEAEKDAKYLNDLINALAKNLTSTSQDQN